MKWTTVETKYGDRRHRAVTATAVYSIYEAKDGINRAFARTGDVTSLDVYVSSVADEKALIAVFDALVVLPAHLRKRD